jgi:hypothetical protein
MGNRTPYKVLQAIPDLHGIKLSRLFALAERKYDRNRGR